MKRRNPAAGKKGECFRNATMFVDATDDEVRVVHGMVTNAEGSRFDHAWVEKHGKVIDPTTGTEMRKARYYRLMDVRPLARYTAEQAMINCIRSGHHGPWGDSERHKGRTNPGVNWSRKSDSAGWVPHNGNIHYDGFTVSMRPSKFLALVPSMDNKPKTDAFLPTAVAFAPCFLLVKWIPERESVLGPQYNPIPDAWRVQNHEGRHRATFAMNAGDEEMPVDVIPFRYNSPHLTRNMVLTPIDMERRARDEGKLLATHYTRWAMWSPSGLRRDFEAVER